MPLPREPAFSATCGALTGGRCLRSSACDDDGLRVLGNDLQRHLRVRLLTIALVSGALGAWALVGALSDVTDRRNDVFGVFLDLSLAILGPILATTCVVACRYVGEDGQPRRRPRDR
jgi:hypothetical protein